MCLKCVRTVALATVHTLILSELHTIGVSALSGGVVISCQKPKKLLHSKAKQSREKSNKFLVFIFFILHREALAK